MNKVLSIPRLPLIIASVLLAAGFWFIPAIPQDLHYHNFSDQRNLLGVPNFYNVFSTLPYLVIGIYASGMLWFSSCLIILPALKPVYITFFIGVTLVCFGSGYYHLQPSNAALLWDRLPMAIAFMAFFTLVIAEFINEVIARKLFVPLVVAGVASVLYWHYTESLQQGDLRPYILVQFLPILLIPYILLTRQSRFSHVYFYWLVLASYVLAKLLELGDAQIFDSIVLLSGHSLKHLISALAPLFVYLALRQRHAVYNAE